MKILYLILALMFMQYVGHSQGELAMNTWSRGLVSQNVKPDKSLVVMLSEIEKKFNVFFNFDPELLSNKQIDNQVTISDDLNETLDRILKPMGLIYKILGNGYYVIYSAQETPKVDKPKAVPSLQQKISDRGDVGHYSERGRVAPILLPATSLETLFRFGINIEGTVTDTEGQPLIGVNIQIKGTDQGTSTDIDGRFRFENLDENAILVVSYVGYQTQEVSVAGRSQVSIVMVSDSQLLDEVVVTAFGIEREKKALSYSVQELDGESMSSVGNSNVVNSLQGKVAGVIVKQYSGAPGTEHRITIRGSRTFTGNNEPLYVVDGLPIASGGRTVDINPNDIKSINVLKGPTAAALYGLRASNGVIIIETRKGLASKDGKPSISFETNFNFDQLSLKPEFQTTYAQGENGRFVPHSAHSWGPRIDTLGTYINQLGESEEAAIYDNVADLFKTGGTYNGNLLISNVLEKGSYAINLGYTNQEGILDNFTMERANVKFAGQYELAESLTIGTSISYSNTNRSTVDVPWWGTFAIPVSYNLKGKPYHDPGDPYKQINFRGQHANFYWALENNLDRTKTARTFGNISLDYNPFYWLKVNYRLGLDSFNDSGKGITEKGSNRTDPPSGGSINNNSRNFQQINSNLNITVDHKITDDIQVDVMVGNEFYDIQSKNLTNNGSDIVIGGFHHISNTLTQTTSESFSASRVFGLFGSVGFSWKNMLYVNATGRNDMVSNMPRGNRSFFYPSIGTGFVFSEALNIPQRILTFGKLRFSLAEVGQAGPAHSTENLFVTGSPGGFTFPFQGLNAFTHSNQLNADDLQPENTRTFEAGIDLRFFSNRIGIDYTYFDTKASGQIYRVPIAPSTGFTSELRNAGEMSIKGHEVVLSLKPIEKSNFQWEIASNFTSYKNTVISLAEGIDQLELGGFRVILVAQPGEEYPSLRGYGYLRDPASGEVVVDNRSTLPNGNPNPRYGMPLRSTEQIILGSAQPDFDIGINNMITYRNFMFSFQIDWRQGGKVSSGYNRLGKLYGILSETEDRETSNYIFPGKKGYYGEMNDVIVDGDNDIPIIKGQAFYQSNEDQINESNVYDATYIRLRELRLGYELPRKWLENSFISSATFFLTGRNLWLHAALPHFDPEMFNTSAGESYNTYPQTKSFGGGLQIKL